MLTALGPQPVRARRLHTGAGSAAHAGQAARHDRRVHPHEIRLSAPGMRVSCPAPLPGSAVLGRSADAVPPPDQRPAKLMDGGPTVTVDTRATEPIAPHEAVFDIRFDPTTSVLTLTGELDRAVTDQVRQYLAVRPRPGRRANHGRPGRLQFIDASGMGALIQLADALHRQQKPAMLRVVNATPAVQRAFAAAQLSHMLAAPPGRPRTPSRSPPNRTLTSMAPRPASIPSACSK
jgi:anti-anti-sigma factor